MKKINYLAIVIALVSACTQPKVKEVLTTTLTGTIENSSNNKITLRGSEMDTTFTFEGNSFSFTFQNENASYYTFIQSGEATSLYLRNGDSLNISVDANEFDESIKYSGTNAAISQHIADGFFLDEKLSNNRDLFSLNEEQFIAKLDSIAEVKSNLLSKNKVNFNDAKFVSLETAKIKYEKTNNLLRFESYHRYYAGEPDFEVSEKYNGNITGYDLNDSSLLGISAYTGFLETYLGNLVSERMEKDTIKYIPNETAAYVSANLDQLSESISNNKVKSNLMYDFLSNFMTYIEHDDFAKKLTEFNSINTSTSKSKKLNAKFDKWKKLAKGTVAPNFQYATVDEDTLSMDDFKGKYVYIDVWATWCGPCMRELPHLEKLQEEFKDKNITFMSISIDNTPEPWKKMVVEKEMKGVQLYADGAWKSSLVEDYMIGGIPRFILVDTEGNIISASTERPSGGIKEIIEGLDNI